MNQERDRLVLLLWRMGWPGALIVVVFLVVATSPWWVDL